MSVAGRERGSSRPPSLPARHGATESEDDDHGGDEGEDDDDQVSDESEDDDDYVGDDQGGDGDDEAVQPLAKCLHR